MTAVHIAVDTATDRLAVAARRMGGDTVEAAVEGARRHAADLLPLLDELLARLGATPADVTLLALADGPGSFTGLRVGAAFAKALTRDHRVELHVAPSLLVRAAAIAEPGARVLAVSSALRGEVYAGCWAFAADGGIACLMAPAVRTIDELGQLPPVSHAIGHAPEGVITALEQRLGRAVKGPPVACPSATVLLDLVGRAGGAAHVRDPDGWEPEYGRPAEAQALWEQRHGRPLPDSTGIPR